MGIRDRAIEAKEAEELGFIPGYPYAGQPKQESLFEGSYRRTSANEFYKKPITGTMKIAISITAEEIGDSANPDSEKYDYNTLINEAERCALGHIEKLAPDLIERYEIDFDSIEMYDEVEVTATLMPIRV